MIPNHKVRVLVVDDDIAVGRSLTAKMVRRGFEVSSASSGEEALRVLRVLDPSLVLLDLGGPGASALDVLGRIKQAKPEVSVIMLSTRHDPETIFAASKLGADDYLPKPFEAADLDVRINKLLDKPRLSGDGTQLRD